MNEGINYDEVRNSYKLTPVFATFLGVSALIIISGISYLIASNTSRVLPANSSVVTEPTGNNLNYNYGIAVGDTLPGLRSTDLNNELTNIAALHVGWIRMDVAWNEIQATSSESFEWGNIDRVVAAANARHIKVLAILDYTPEWARERACSNSPKCEPSDPAAFATFAQAAAARYAPQGVTTWEIWNEENSSDFWLPAPDPVAYTALLKDAYTAIKTQDPSATVISGGLSAAVTSESKIAPIDFLTQMYADGAKGYFDAVAFHPYTFPNLVTNIAPSNPWAQMNLTNPSLRSVMTNNGDANKKIWITEFGAPTGGPGSITNTGDNPFSSADHVTEALQAQILQSAITNLKSDNWAGPFFWYSYQDLGTDNSTVENFFGLLRIDGSPKPAYTLYSQLINP